MIKFNQNAWVKPYIDMNTDLRKKQKNDFENDIEILNLTQQKEGQNFSQIIY